MFLMGIIIMAAHAGIFGYVWEIFYSNVIIQPFYKKGNWLVIALYAMILYIFSKIYNGYKVGSLRISEIIYSQTLAILFTNVIMYLQISLIGRYFLWSLPIVIMTVAQMCLIVLWACISNKVYYNVFPPRKMILVYGSHSATKLVGKMSKRDDKYLICSAVNADEELDLIIEKIKDFSTVILCDVKARKRNKILKYCYENSIRVYLTPKISDVIVSGADKMHLFDTPLFLCRNTGLSLDQRFAKRCVDIFLSLIALIISGPFMLIVALAIKLYDRGPVLFKQKRLTIDGKVFEVYKFRSMITDAEKDGIARLASEHDDRITPVGKIIRKLRLDELPQILNILNGDMSIVGPRPERPEIAKEYKKQMPEFDFRLKVKAGLTGYAQILGKYNTLPYDKLKLDLIYIESYSMLLDLKLMLMTVKVLFLPESTQGVEEGKSTPS